jgi:uncharacterized damage-inducible protein DinB
MAETAEIIDIEAIIEENARARAELMQAIDALPSGRRVEGGLFGEWSLKDVLVHIAGWQDASASLMEMLARGERPVLEGYDGDTDAYNDRLVVESRDQTWEQVMNQLRRTRERYEAGARAMRDRLPAERLVPGRTAERLARADGARHDREHTAQIMEWRKEHEL